jgi:benzylsuccinate CoA-transferase BbsF subunit
MTKQVFEGLKVADFAWVAVGPQIGRELAEHGATVVRVESHKAPDSLRTYAPYYEGKPGLDRTMFGVAFNTQKYSMSLDLSKPRGREVARKLVAWADLVTESFTPGNMAKWGLDYESCKKIKPDIVYFSTCLQGQYGPHSQLNAYGAATAAMAGYSEVTGSPDRDPNIMYNNYTDFISPWYLTISVIGALLHRKKTGEGMYVEQSQYETGVQFMGPAILDYVVNGRVATRMGNADPNMAPHDAFPCLGNDRWISIAVQSDAEWQALCRAMGEPEWTKDPKFGTFLGRKEHKEELNKLVAEWTRSYEERELMSLLQAAGVPAGVVEYCEDMVEKDPQFKLRQAFRRLPNKVQGMRVWNAPSYILSKTPNHIWKAGAIIGEDNEFVYKEILGYSDEDIANFLMEGVITTETDVPVGLRPK